MSEFTPPEAVSRREALKRGLKIAAGSALTVSGSSKIGNNLTNGDRSVLADEAVAPVAQEQSPGIAGGVAVTAIGSELLKNDVQRSRRNILKAIGATAGLKKVGWNVTLSRKKGL